MTRYKAVPAADLIVHAADELFLVYHRPSGQTHVLEPAMIAIMRAIEVEPLDPDAVLASIEATHDLEIAEGETPIAIIAARLTELGALGLIEAAP